MLLQDAFAQWDPRMWTPSKSGSRIYLFFFPSLNHSYDPAQKNGLWLVDLFHKQKKKKAQDLGTENMFMLSWQVAYCRFNCMSGWWERELIIFILDIFSIGASCKRTGGSLLTDLPHIFLCLLERQLLVLLKQSMCCAFRKVCDQT